MFVMAAGLTACQPAPAPDAGRRDASADPPAVTRVASMVPAATDWIVALGAADRLVVRTDFDRAPSLRGLPSIGGGLDPSVEWLAARKPDLVIAWPDGPTRSTTSRLEALGIPVYVAPAETIEDALGIAADLGRLLDLEGPADSAVAAVRAGLARVALSVEDHPTPSVLFLIGLDPLTAAGPDTFVSQLIAAAGGRNVLSEMTLRWPPVSLEEVVRRDPDVVLVGTAVPVDAAALGRRPGWRGLRAVREGRVHAVDPDLVNRWGPHLHESADLLARLIHGEAPGKEGS
jgi:iron complex transport system substrate-binding protein